MIMTGKKTRISKELEGGAKIKFLFYKLFKELSDDQYKATKRYENKDVERAISLHEGAHISGFPSVDVFSFLVNPELEKIRAPSIDCVNEIYDYLEQLSQSIIEQSFSKLPDLSNVIYESVQSIMLSAKEKTKLLVEAIIESELSYMYTSDRNYLETRTSFIPQLSEEEKDEVAKEVSEGTEESKKEKDKKSYEQEIKKKEALRQLDKLQKMSDKEMYVIELKKRIDTYFHIVIRNIRDQIPKLIGFFLVKGSQEKLQFELYNKVVNVPGILKSIGEAPRVTEERNTLAKAQCTLENSLKAMKRSLESVGMDDDEEEIFYEIEKAKKEKKDKVKEEKEAKMLKKKQKQEKEKEKAKDNENEQEKEKQEENKSSIPAANTEAPNLQPTNTVNKFIDKEQTQEIKESGLNDSKPESDTRSENKNREKQDNGKTDDSKQKGKKLGKGNLFG